MIIEAKVDASTPTYNPIWRREEKK